MHTLMAVLYNYDTGGFKYLKTLPTWKSASIGQIDNTDTQKQS
jgi:hypothetical protein